MTILEKKGKILITTVYLVDDSKQISDRSMRRFGVIEQETKKSLSFRIMDVKFYKQRQLLEMEITQTFKRSSSSLSLPLIISRSISQGQIRVKNYPFDKTIEIKFLLRSNSERPSKKKNYYSHTGSGSRNYLYNL